MNFFDFPQWATDKLAGQPKPMLHTLTLEEASAAQQLAVTEREARERALLQGFEESAALAPKRKGWPKGKPRGPRK